MHRFSAVVAFLVGSAHAAPVQLTHSGRMLSSSGEPLNGPVSLTLSLFDVGTGGTAVWSRDYALTAEDGYYTVLLEGGSPSLVSSMFASGTRYLEIASGGGVLGSRQALNAVPSALHATSVSGGSVVVPTATAGTCAEPGSLARDSGTGALRVCHGAGPSAAYVDVASAEQIGALIDAALGTAATPLGQRVFTASTRARAYAEDYNHGHVPVSGIIVPFTSRGGPIQVNQSIAMHGGDHSSCRVMIDGIPASLYTELDATYYWSEGLEFTQDGWAMWDPPMLYEGVAQGRHTLTIECHTDSSSADTQLGNGRMTNTVSVIAYDPVENAVIKAQSDESVSDQDVSTSWTNISGISMPFTATGGWTRISWGVPMSGGSHSSCRPLVDGTLPGSYDGDTSSYIWSEGLVYTADGWNMHNRTRLYANVPAGPHTLTMQCVTDGGTVSIGNSRMGVVMSVTTYPASGGGVTVAMANRTGEQTGNFTSWTAITGLSTTLTTSGGPVEIGVSLPLYASGGTEQHAACRPVLNGQPIQHPVDDFSYRWHDGLIRSNDQWGMWDRVRVYDNIAAGTYTLGVQCTADTSTTLRAGVGSSGNGGTSHVWAIAYDN